MQFINLDKTGSYKKLKTSDPFDVRSLSTERIQTLITDFAADFRYSYAATPVTNDVIDILEELSKEQAVIEKYTALASGEIMNTGEKRRVLHHLLRGELVGPVVRDGHDLGSFYREQRERFSEFANRVRAGEERSVAGVPFRTVVQIGIGGSDLGPRALYLALKDWAHTNSDQPVIEARFISNVDPDDAASVLADIEIESTLFVLVSKSGTTQETLTNAQFVREIADRRGVGFDVTGNFVAVTSQTSPLATAGTYRDSFYIDDFVGGRYSATSAVGGVALSIAFGPEIFDRLLLGAHSADKIALEAPFRENATMLDALIGIYERNVLEYPATAILPYSQALSRFPAHLQQLDMESNGKSVNRAGEPILYSTGPVVFGEPGTNGQHSFYQLLHQGTDIVPLQFIGFQNPQTKTDTVYDGSTSQTKLNANLAAQIVAFALGRPHENKNKYFAGGRPSTLLVGRQLTPESLGALLAHYENKVMFQGFVWNINSFDQEGVQLGKILTKELLHGAPGTELKSYASLLGAIEG